MIEHPLRERLMFAGEIEDIDQVIAVVAAWLRDEAADLQAAWTTDWEVKRYRAIEAMALTELADAIDPPADPEAWLGPLPGKPDTFAVRYGGVHPSANVETVEGL